MSAQQSLMLLGSRPAFSVVARSAIVVRKKIMSETE